MTSEQLNILTKMRHCLSCSCPSCPEGKHTSALAMSKDCHGCLRVVVRFIEAQERLECAKVICEECQMGLAIVTGGKYKGLHFIPDDLNDSYCQCRAEKIYARGWT